MKKTTIIILVSMLLFLTSCINKNKNDPEPTSSIPDALTIIDNNGWSAPDYENVEPAKYDNSKFKYDINNRITYSDENYISKFGIDISSFQGDIDWQKVASDGVDFVMLRIGFRGYGPSGLIYEDENFEYNYIQASNAGLDIGVYFFSQCISEEEAIEEADFIYDIISDKTINYPIVFDWEHVDDSSARTESIQSESVTLFAASFCDRIKNYGLNPAIYFNCSDGYNLLNLDKLSDYNFWLAEYDDTPSFYYHYSMWQYSDKGTVNGISGNVDFNISLEPIENE